MKRALFLLTMLTALSWSVTNAQVSKTFACNFENATDTAAWTFINGSAINQWHIDTATNNGSGSHAMYISNDNGATNTYTNSQATSFVIAYHEVYIMGGTTTTLSFDWKAWGESNYDYLRVALIPVDFNFTPNTLPSGFSNTTLPTGWIPLDGGSGLCNSSNWQTRHRIDTVQTGGYYRLAFIWRNDNSVGTQPPAAIDNVTFIYTESSCLPPTNLTITSLTPNSATIHWDESASSTATGYGIWMYTSPITDFVNTGLYYTGGIGAGGTSWIFSDEFVDPNTQYYAYVRTGCGNSHSEFVEIPFHTPPTCAIPLNPQVTIQNKSTATLSWTPGDNSQASNYEYVLSTSPLTADQLATSGPNVSGITETSVELTNLTPEATYYLYLRNNCGGTDPSPYTEAVSFTMPIACNAVSNLTATNITTNSFMLTWENGQWETSERWSVEINDGNYLVTGQPTISISGLTPGTNYTVTVSTECGATYSDSVTIMVNTLNDGDMPIGQHTSQSYDLPVNNYYKYSYTQQIFTASELQAGKITKIAFQYLYEQPMTKVTDATIYLGHTTKSSFDSQSDWVSFSDLTPVYTGSMNCSQGWNTFELNTPFVYNGTDNLVIAVHKNADTTGFNNGSYVFATSQKPTTQTLYYRSDDFDCSPESPTTGTPMWSRNIVRITFTDVRHDPVTVDLGHPYNDSFEGDLQWDLYQGPCVNAWAQGTATHNGEGTKALYVSNNGGADNNYSINNPATIYAAKQFALAAGQYDIQFDWKGYGEGSYDYLRAALVPATTQLTATTSNLTGLSSTALPSGWIALDGGSKLNLWSESWVTREEKNLNIEEDGIYMVVFVWRNDNSEGTPPPAAIDNFSITRVGCQMPVNTQAQNITSQSANLYWEMDGGNSESFTYILHTTEYIDTTNTSNYAYATGTNVTLQNLNPYTNYFYTVKANCGTDGQSRWTKPTHFMTLPDCGEKSVRQFALGTQPNTGNSYPAYNYSSATYGANWMIFTADEIMEEAEFTGAIKGLAWRTPQAGGFPFQIYMAQTDKTEFESATDTVDRATMTKVFDGYPDFLANEWSEVVFDTPFEYDATGNLLVMVYRSSSSGNYPFEYSHYNDTKTIYRYGAQGLTSGGTSNNRINTRFTMCVTEDECLPVQNLTISNFTPIGGDFSWTDGRNSEVSTYEMACVPTGEAPTPLYGFNGLIGDGVYGGTLTSYAPYTTYDFYVRANCGTSVSPFKKVTFTTECDYLTLPYTCGFELEDGVPASGSYRMPSCWHRINDANSNYNYLPYVNSSASYAYHGSYSLYFYSSTSSSYPDNQLAVLPPVSTPMNQNQMTLWAKYSSSYSSSTIQVGTMTDASDISTFVADTTLQLTSEYREYVVRFHSNGTFPAIRMVKSSTVTSAYIDDITLETAPICPKPLYVTVDNITSTETSISWTPGGEESLWQIDYMSDDGASGSSPNISENPYTITNLMANKAYTIRVRAICDGSHYSAWSTPVSFRTSCATTIPLPFTENFDSYTQGITNSASSYPSGYPNVDLPACWTFPNMATSSSEYPQTYLYNTSDPDHGKVLVGHPKSGNGGSWFAVLPKVSEDPNNMTLSFSYAGTGNYTTSVYPVLKIGYMTDPTDTTTFRERFVCPSNSSTSQYIHKELILDSIPPFNAYIAFKAEPRSASSYYQVFLDDIRLEVTPTCYRPTNLSVDDITPNSIMLTWEDPQDVSPSYQIAYGPSSSFDIRYSSTYETTTSTTTSCNLTGLQSGTEYTFAVRTDCPLEAGGVETSNWSQTFSATTSCLLSSLPYMENFDSYRRGISISTTTPSNYPNVDIPDCWTFVNRTNASSGKYFLTSSSSYAVTGNALLLYGSNTTPLYAILPAFDEPLTDLQISFTYRFSSEGANNVPLTLGYMTNPADPSTFTSISTFASNTDIVNAEQLLDAVILPPTTQRVYLAFMYHGSSVIGIDNVCVKNIPDCRKPELTLAENWFGSSMIYFNCVNPNAVVNDTFNYQLATGLAETFDLEDASTYTLSNGHATRPTFFNLTWATTPNTKYSFAIRVQCSDNTWSEWSNVVTRKTECNVVDLPYEEYFDTYTQGISTGYNCPSTYPNVDLPECWTIVNASEYRTQKPQAFLTSSRNYTKSGNSLMLYASEETPAFAMLPKFFEAGGSQPLKISFYYANNTLSNAGTLSIGYLYRNNEYYDTTSFRELYSCPITTDMTYVEQTIDSLPNGARITLRYSGGSSNSGVWIDEVEVVPASTCTQSVSITGVSYISSNRFSVQFDGERLTDGSQYKIACGPAATFDPNDPSTYEHSATFTFGHSYVISDLQPNTEYAIAMAIVCPDWVTGNWSRIVTAKTLCADYTTLPYSEDFNSYTNGISSTTIVPSAYPNITLPECWSFQNTSYNSPAFLTSSSSYAVSGNALVLNPAAKDTIIAILPTFEEDIRNLKLTFSYKNQSSSASYPALSVGYMEGTYDAPVTFHEIAQLERTTSWTYAEVLFDEVPGWAATNYTTYIAIKFASPQYSGRAYIDNVVVKPAICPVPLDLTATNVTAESVSLSWDNPYPASQYEVRYAPTSGVDMEDEPYETVTVTSNSATISGLSDNTEYTFAVRALCDEDDWSDWSSEITVTTPCGVITELPYIENFDSYTEGTTTESSTPSIYPNVSMPNCWTFINRSESASAKPIVYITNLSTYVTNEKALFFKASTSVPVYAVLPAFEKDIHKLKLSFYYRTEWTSTSSGNLIVGYMTDPSDTTTFVALQTLDRTTTMTPVEVDFHEVPTDIETARIVIKRSSAWNDSYASIDEVMVEEIIDPCDPVTVNADHPYTDDFESDQCWQLINLDPTCSWAWGSATGNGGNALYVSNNGGLSNTYTNSQPATIYATKLFTLDAGLYNFQYDWKAYGEGGYDFLRVALVPASAELSASTSLPSGLSTTSLPSGWIALDGGRKLNLSSSWTTQASNEITVYEAGNYMVVFVWTNDNSSGTNPPAAIDNFSITAATCLMPTNVVVNDITESSASISWTPRNEETTWDIKVVDTRTLSTLILSSSATTEYITRLQPGTQYDISVRAACGDVNVSAWSETVRFVTLCAPLSLPYTCGFEEEEGLGEGSSPLPLCWNRINDATSSNNYYPYAQRSSSYSVHNGSRVLYFYASTNNTYAEHMLAALPEISSDYPMNGNQMTLWAKSGESPSSIMVGTMTDPTDLSTFVTDDTLNLTPDYQEYVVKFHSNGTYPAIMMTRSSSLLYAYVDDITIEPVPSCAKPKHVLASSITQTSASITWTPGDAETQWEVGCLGENDAEMMTAECSTNPFVFTGLNPGTKYTVYVRAICNDENDEPDLSEWSHPGTFKTLCLPLSTQYYAENFDSYSNGISTGTSALVGYPDVDMPNCWSFLNRSESSASCPRAFLTSYSTYATSGNSLFFVSSNSTPLYAILPAFEENIQNLMLLFTYRNESTSSSNGTLSVGYMTDPSDESTFVTLQEMGITTTLTPVILPLNTIPADVTSANIAFKYAAPSNNMYLSIEDVIVQTMTSCYTPQHLSVTGLSSNAISLEWDDTGASAYQVAYAPSSTFNLDSGLYQIANTSTNSASISGLTENTAYKFAVRVDCGDGEFSNWSLPVAGQTNCLPIATLPYTENFDSYVNGITSGSSTPSGYPNVDLPECWLFPNRSETTFDYPRSFLTSSSAYAVSGNALFFVNNNATPLFTTLPLFEENIQNLMMTFTYVYESISESNGTLSVGYMTNPNDASTFVELSSYDRTTTKTTTEVFFNAIPADVSSAYIAFKYITNTSNGWYAAIDDVTVQQIPACMEPREVSITEASSNAISLGWTVVIENPSSYQVAYAPSSTFNLDSNAYQTLTSNTTSATVGGLTDNTSYSFAVRSNCGEGEWSDWSVVVSSSTTCLPITSLPYICSFETEDGVGTESYPMPSCWYRYNDGAGGYNYYPYVSSNSSSAYHGTRYLYFYSYTTTTYADNQVAVLPEINTSAYPMNGNQMVLWARGSSNPATIKIGTMTNPYDLSTFVVDDSLVLTSSYREYVVKFNSTGSFPAILMHKTAASAAAYVDNITIEVVPSCPKPMHVNVDTISETSATISWTSVGEEDQWEVKCVSMDSTDIQTLTATTNPFVFTGLHPATRYNVSVKAVCGDNEESVWSASEAFRTLPACEPITTLPYTCGFEPDIVPDGNNRLPDCWQRYNDSADSSRSIYPYVSSSSSSSHTGLQSLYFYNYTSSSYPDHEIAILPEISTSAYPMNGNQMVLWARGSSNPATIKIGTMTNPYDLSTFVVDDSLVLTSSYREYVVKFNSTGSFPAILLTKSSATQYAYVDNITIEVLPSCPKPMHVNVDTITETSATISWTSVGEEDQWEVKCVSMDSTDIQTLTATTNPFVFSGLQPATRYDFYVRAICGYNDGSVWSVPAVGRTTPVCSPIVTLPYTENFDSYINGVSTSTSSPTDYPNVDMPDCWTFLNRSESTSLHPRAFLTSSTNYAVAGNALFFTSSSTTPLYAVLPTFEDDIQNLKLSFAYRNEGVTENNGTLSVGYLTDPADASTFVEVQSFARTTTLTPVEVSFSEIPAGVTVSNIAFKYNGGTSANYYLSIDEVMVTRVETGCAGLTIPYNEDFEAMTSGSTPNCWSFLPDVANATVPLVSAGSANAQSGNNSVHMTSRGILVLPEITNVENVNNLMMTFYVKQRKFAQRIAVGVMTDPNDPTTFTEIDRFFNDGNYSTPVQQTINFSSYSGSGKYIAFRNVATNSDAMSQNWIDDISITEIPPVTCEGITIPYYQNFDSITTNTGAPTGVSPDCWTFLPDVSNATIPQINYGSAYAQSGNYSLAMTSRGIYVLPEITNVTSVNGLALSFYVRQKKYAQRIAVGVMSDPTDPSTFTEVERFFNDGNYSTPVYHIMDFSSYTGNGKYIAFRNVVTNSDALSQNWIDDINIFEGQAVTCNGITVPYEENFDSITTNTGTPTGASPACWTFLPDVDNATIPQVSYGTDNAQSGNYSLAMTSRGIYVMPEVTNIDNVSDLVMTFYVKQRKFAHRIAVGVMTDPADPTTFVEIDRFYNDGNYSTLVQHSVNFSSYTGSGKYIAFRNVATNSDALSQNWIDNISLQEFCGITVPYVQNFDSLTTNTGTSTGASPRCWTFLPDVDNANIPQVSYGADNAQSGNYSLAMTSRGIYVMPEIINVDNVNNLTMTFYVKQRKFAHRIAVGVMTDPTDPNTFVEIDRFFNDGNYSTPVQQTVNFASYTGNGKYIAFRNVATNSDALSNNWIDDINITEAEAVTCEGITIPYSENFDAITTSTGVPTGVSPACWTFLPDVDNATIPQISYGSANAQSGNYSLAMTSRGIYALPEITNVDNISNLTMTFYVKQRKFASRIAVGVMTDPTDPNTFVEIDRFFNDGNYTTMVMQTVDFSSYTGNGKYIAFRNVTTSTDASSQNWIDDINISEAETVICDGITVPYTQNFDAITSNTGAPTGVSPACWTFLPDVDGATIPQISYGSANAQSGNYSLAMTSRGIYALPEITNVESINGLTMTFYVKQRKYAHRIAVGVMSDPTDPNTFVEVERFFNGGEYTNLVQHTVDFSSYTGTGKYIAFRNVATNSDALSNNWIDDIYISATEERSAEVEQTSYEYTDNDATNEALNPTSIDDFDLDSFTVYPNPTTGKLNLGGMEAKRVEVNSLTGQKVAVFENTSRIDISNLPSGVYILKVALPQGEAVRKVVKR